MPWTLVRDADPEKTPQYFEEESFVWRMRPLSMPGAADFWKRPRRFAAIGCGERWEQQ